MTRHFGLALACGCCLLAPLSAQTVTLREQFPVGYRYRVSSRVELSGELTPPAVAGQPAPTPLTIRGSSTIDYDERILAADGPEVSRTLRLYRRYDLKRKVGTQDEESTLRGHVRRLVILRHGHAEVPFSPDGPLTWGEIELVRTDVFTPALAGLLPDRPVQVGERWQVHAHAVMELTDLEKIDDGGLACRLEQITELSGRRHARVSLEGSVRGINEDGPTRQQIVGSYFFDLESNHLSYLSFRGTHFLLGKDGKEAGRIDGQFVLTRQAHVYPPELADETLRGLVVEPNVENTQLFYDNSELGVRFLYPRRWRVSGVQGKQVTVDEPSGSAGVLITMEPLTRVPAAAQFLVEVRDYFLSQKGKIVRIDPPRMLFAGLEYFSLEVEMGGQRLTMDYYLVRQNLGGAVLAARLAGDLSPLRSELDRIAKSLTVTGVQR